MGAASWPAETQLAAPTTGMMMARAIAVRCPMGLLAGLLLGIGPMSDALERALAASPAPSRRHPAISI
jgi:hypothetical protein